MSSGVLPPVVGPPVVEEVLLVDVYERVVPGQKSITSSLPGHLIQLTVAGSAAHVSNGRRYRIEPNHLIWFHEDETVQVHVMETPWRFFTVNFTAPRLPPPPFEDRVRVVTPALRCGFDSLLSAWRCSDAAPVVRELRVQAALLDLLADVPLLASTSFETDILAQLWWRVENILRADLSMPVTLAQIASLAGKSASTIARSCYHAVGTSPVRRMKTVRMSLARGLVRRSELRMTEIAARLGYPRVHEFSRDYRRFYGLPPTSDREEYHRLPHGH